eukprot:712236-Hanusia_phi.AAC.1
MRETLAGSEPLLRTSLFCCKTNLLNLRTSHNNVRCAHNTTAADKQQHRGCNRDEYPTHSLRRILSVVKNSTDDPCSVVERILGTKSAAT